MGHPGGRERPVEHVGRKIVEQCRDFSRLDHLLQQVRRIHRGACRPISLLFEQLLDLIAGRGIAPLHPAGIGDFLRHI